MNVVHINASDLGGGAARSCYRLHQSLLRQGVHSSLLVQHKHSDDPTIEVVESPVTEPEALQRIELVQRVFATRNRTDISNTHFSISLAGSDLSRHPVVESADILHLHWVASMLTPVDVRRLMALGKPVVWTLHDLRPLTGGCHFPAGCAKFQHSCTDCPQLRHDPFGLPAAALRDQVELIDATDLTVIAPSQWIAEQARLSSLLRNEARIECIPNGVDVDVFSPRSRTEARAALGLARDGIYILCGADHTDEKRKGFMSLARVLGEVVHDPRFVSSGARVLWVGAPPGQAYEGMPLLHLGRVQQEEQMALAYAASDLFLLPSLEDNLPNMLLEALSCGTPVIAYSVGGIPEVLQDGVNGRVIPAANEPEFIRALLSLVGDASAREAMGRRARALASETLSAPLQASRHLALYRDLIQAGKFATASRQSTLPQEHADTGAVFAVDALRESLTIHCLAEEVRLLEGRVQALGNAGMRQARLIENLRTQLDARQEVIDDLQDHLRRAEETCAARLDVIESQKRELDARSEVIASLQDHWQRAEEACAARLAVIEELETRSRTSHVERSPRSGK